MMSENAVEEIWLGSTVAEIQQAVLRIATLARETGLSAEKVHDLRLASEELLVNIHLYAYPDGVGPILIRCARTDEGVQVELCDDGAAFDPVAWQQPTKTSAGIEDKADGGMGITLAKGLVDHLFYKRVDAKNVMTLLQRMGDARS